MHYTNKREALKAARELSKDRLNRWYVGSCQEESGRMLYWTTTEEPAYCEGAFEGGKPTRR